MSEKDQRQARTNQLISLYYSLKNEKDSFKKYGVGEKHIGSINYLFFVTQNVDPFYLEPRRIRKLSNKAQKSLYNEESTYKQYKKVMKYAKAVIDESPKWEDCYEMEEQFQRNISNDEEESKPQVLMED